MSSDDLKMNVMLILDIIGKPKEYLIESLGKHIDNMDKEKGVVVKSKKIAEPEFMKGQKEFYTTFAEVEVEVDDILTLVAIMFKYMPAHVEIVSPEMLAMTNGIFNDTLNELVRRLHGYDELARVMNAEKQILVGKIKELGGEVPEGVMPPSVLREPFDEEENSEDEDSEKKTGKKKK